MDLNYPRALWLALLTGLIGLAVGCASTGKSPVITEAVGPAPNAFSRAFTSSIQVFSATEQFRSGSDIYYYPHTSYSIYDRAGKRVKSVPNRVGMTDQTPEVVRIPPGDYVVIALAEGFGRVRIPVVVKPGRLTEVRLERSWKPPMDTPASDLVTFPDGQPIGWKAGLEAKS
jgi:hypothetical protein